MTMVYCVKNVLLTFKLNCYLSPIIQIIFENCERFRDKNLLWLAYDYS